LYDLGEPQSRTGSPQDFSGGFPQFQDQDQDEEDKAEGKQGLDNQDGLKVLPFEFVALEACLEAACSCLESEVSIFFLVQWIILSLLLLLIKKNSFSFALVLFSLVYYFLFLYHMCFKIRQRHWSRRLIQP
jgi:hypothetical protein